MTRPYLMDLRAAAVRLVEAGQSRRAVARLLGLGEATVIRWMQRQTATGSCAVKPMGGPRHAVLLPERDWLLARIAAAPEITVRGLRAAEQNRPDVACKRDRWRRYQGRVDASG
jgi:transposase